jgi:hypothetical protein
MKFNLETVCYGLLMVCFGFFIFLPVRSNDLVKSKFCRIDSIYMKPKYEFSPELLTKYHTACGLTFTSNKEYSIGDSIEVKTIILQ